MLKPYLLLTCEHASERIPAAYAHLFDSRDAGRALADHRGHDIGALQVARALGRRLRAPLIATGVSRLLVDANRSEHHPDLWSRFSASLSTADKQRVLQAHYRPHRQRVQTAVERAIARGQRVVHVGVHSFTPRLHGQTRNAELGLLYDPSRAAELALCKHLQQALRGAAPGLRVRRNYPYRGAADGLTTALRRRYPARAYLGIELELNQALLVRCASSRESLIVTVCSALRALR